MNVVEFKPYTNIFSIESSIRNTFKSGGSFDKSPLNLSRYIPFMRIGSVEIGGNTRYIEVNRHQLENRLGDPASNYAYRGDISLESIEVDFVSSAYLPVNIVNVELKAYHPFGLNKLKSLFNLGSLVRIDFGWSSSYFGEKYSNTSNRHNGDAMSLQLIVKNFNLSYNEDTSINVHLELIDSSFQALSSYDIDFFDISIFKDSVMGVEFSTIKNSGPTNYTSLSGDKTPAEFRDKEKYYSFHNFLNLVATEINRKTTSTSECQLRFQYSELNSKAKCFLYAPGVGKNVGNIALSQSTLQSLRKESKTFTDYFIGIFDKITVISGGAINLQMSVNNDGRTVYIFDGNLADENYQAIAIPLSIGSKNSIVKSFNLNVDTGDNSNDAVISIMNKFGNTSGYIIPKNVLKKFERYFVKPGSQDLENSGYLKLEDPEKAFDITKALSSDNPFFTFILTKKGFDALSATPDTGFINAISELNINLLDMSIMNGTLTLRGFSGISPLNHITLSGTGQTFWDTTYNIRSVKHRINAQNWETELDIIMGNIGQGLTPYNSSYSPLSSEKNTGQGPVAAPSSPPTFTF